MSIVTGEKKNKLTKFERSVKSTIQLYSESLRELSATGEKSGEAAVNSSLCPSLRQLRRLWNTTVITTDKNSLHCRPSSQVIEDIKSKIRNMHLVAFMPDALQSSIESTLSKVDEFALQNFSDPALYETGQLGATLDANTSNSCLMNSDVVQIGRVTMPLVPTTRKVR